MTSYAEQALRERERRSKHRKAKAGVWMGAHRQETTADAAAQIEMQENYLRNYHRPLLQKIATPLAPPDDEQPKPPPTAKR